MKNFERLLITILVAVTPLSSFAQIFGIKAGFNLSNMVIKYNDQIISQDLKMNPGFNVGGTAEFPVSEWLSIESELLLSTKGYKMSMEESYEGSSFKYERKLNLLYLNIPAKARAKVNVGKVNIYGEAGPYFGIGISGKEISTDTYNGEETTVNEKIEWGTNSETDLLRRSDFGLSFGAGVQVKAFQFGFNYDLGLSNIMPESIDNGKIMNRVLGISLGYRFGRE